MKIRGFSENVANLSKLPFVFFICFTYLFYYLGYSLLSGIAVFLISMYTNWQFGKIGIKLYKAYMKEQDKRVKLETECLSNIKMIK